MSERKQIILYLVCTRKYFEFVQPLLTSVEKYFLTNHDVAVILFTDNPYRHYSFSRMIAYVEIPSYKYPEVTLRRYHYVTEHKKLFEKSDVIWYLDVDMLIVAPITEETLPDGEGLVSVEHPGFWKGGWGSHGTHKKSLFYVPPEKREGYYCGGTQSGSTKSYLRMAKILSENIDKDLEIAKEIGYTQNNGILGEWNDETAYNWYLKNENVDGNWKILSPSYCYPHWEIPFEKKILALEKIHSEIRS